MAKFASPNKPVKSTILLPRKKLTTQLPPKKSISIPSSIINLEHAVEISSWIDRRSTTYNITEIPYVFKLLLRGSRDGIDIKTFHKLCDNIPGLIVVIKVENSNEILGGYNPLDWKSTNSGKYAVAPDSFIYSLKNEIMKESILSRVNDQSYAIYNYQYNGPWFYYFGHHDPWGPERWYYKSNGNTYQPPIRNATDGYFSIEDYEVFQICKNV
ncbi:hypothetical protein C2G38_2056029 [Gigaspora rosea]|uniref:TLDc domain-containing protein n=1 Tax=Gigaspora rosea TaxID=44941 RepID=A0A397W4V0_9GLOM|nr:hypothetical protein C2G38_2056029 [Gigaspora rosea]